MPDRHVPEYVLKHVPKNMLRHMPDKHVYRHVPRHVLNPMAHAVLVTPHNLLAHAIPMT